MTDRRCCWHCEWWDDGGDAYGSCGWVERVAIPFWAEVAEPASKLGLDGYTHFDAGSDCEAFRGRDNSTAGKRA